MSEVKKRMNYADMMRGLAVVSVVFYHLLAPCVFKTVSNHFMGALLSSFFILTGFLYRPGKRQVRETIRIRTIAIMKPFFQYSLLFWIIGSICHLAMKTETIIDALCCLRNFYGGCIWNRELQNLFQWQYHSLGSRYPFLAPFWFLPAMMFAGFLFYPIAEKVLPSVKKTSAAIIALFGICGILRYYSVSLVYNLQLVPFWSALMLVGALSASEKWLDLTGLSQKRKWVIYLLFLTVGSIVCLYSEPALSMFRGTFAQGNEGLSMMEVILSSVCVTYGLMGVFRLLEENGVQNRWLAWAGTHSMDIFLFHVFFAWVISLITGFSIKYAEPVSSSVLIESVLLTFACLFLSLGVDFLRKALLKRKPGFLGRMNGG